ncbi:MAG: SpoIID/LytB domain-containing protein [Cyanobacteria bacterium REEB67]|nr:SpoIID/LytB domain-containing protein [Cyanobacteria bacterium REEB67]
MRVKLFSSHEALPEIYVSAPFQIVSPVQQHISAGVFRIATAGGVVVVGPLPASHSPSHSPSHLPSRSPAAASVSQKRAILRARQLVLSGISGQLLHLSLQPREAPRLYRGNVSFSPASSRTSSLRGNICVGDRGAVLAVNEVDTRSYLISCVGSEALASFAPEALKAQAVISTTLLERSAGRKSSDYLLDNTTEQSYLGATAERPEVRNAVDKVFGQVLFYDGRPIEVFFCSTCGGMSSRPDVFGGVIKDSAYPYLREQVCNYCRNSPFFKILKSSLKPGVFAAATGLRGVKIVSSHLGRPCQVDVDVDVSGQSTDDVAQNGRKISATAGFLPPVDRARRSKQSMTGYDFWLLLGKDFGFGFVPSTFYSIEEQKDGSLSFLSKGSGHGVGLCQWGADGMARAGRGYKEILQFYFPGTNLKVAGAPSLYH